MMKNEALEAALDELKQHGIESTVAYASRHIQVRWLNRLGQPRFATVSRRDSHSWHALNNTRRQVRNTLRDDGMLPETDKSPPTAPRPPSRIEQLENDLKLLNTRVARVEQLLKGASV
jgi:hypothetical protein